MLVTTSRDKKVRFWDVRQEKPAHEVPSHAGAKNSRCVWLGDHDRVATTGFSKMSERQLGLWDIRNPAKPVGGDFIFLDSSSGVGMPFWDDGSQILYIAGKGDGNIRYYEFENDKFEYLSEYKSPEPQRGLAFMPKRGVNTHENEVMRAFKTVNDAYVEPISFVVPRRAEVFQEDIYPPTVGTKAGVSSGEWLGGSTALPPKISMEDIYEGKEPTQIASEPVQSRPTATQSAPKPEPAPTASVAQAQAVEATKAPAAEPQGERFAPTAGAVQDTPSGNENKQSMSDMASKFADKEEAPSEEDEDSSSFEEVEKPVSRSTAAAPTPTEPKSLMTENIRTGASGQRSPPTASTSADAVSTPPRTVPESKVQESPASAPNASSAAGGLRDVLQEIRGMLQSQGKQIEMLTSEVAQLKTKVGE